MAIFNLRVLTSKHFTGFYKRVLGIVSPFNSIIEELKLNINRMQVCVNLRKYKYSIGGRINFLPSGMVKLMDQCFLTL